MTEPLDWALVPAAGIRDRNVTRRVKVWEKTNTSAGRYVTARVVDEGLRLEAWADRVQTRTIDSFVDHPGLTEQIQAAFGLGARPWRVAGVNEALGVPAIFRAVTLISNTTGSLAVEAYRKGAKLADEDTPAIVKRPDPFRIPRDFYRDTAFHLATRGEFWWWVAARDQDGYPLSLIVVPPWEVTVEDSGDRLRPTIKWNDREMRREDMRQGTFLPDGYRGVGPLQLCGAAVSVAVESQEWAANFFTEDGGYPSLIIKSASDLGDGEADTLREQWMSKPHNTPRVIDQGIESVEEVGVNAQSSGMLEGREHNKGDAANMFGVPGALLEYGRPGSSLTYQNVTEVFTTFVKTALAPDYLEPIEQHLSDLLPRSTVARFNVKGFLRADIKTRFEVYKLGIESGVMTPEDGQREEGYIPGDVETAPVPFSPPAAIPSVLPTRGRTEEMVELRCDGMRTRRRSGVAYIAKCDKLLSTTGQFVGTCPRCKKHHAAA